MASAPGTVGGKAGSEPWTVFRVERPGAGPYGVPGGDGPVRSRPGDEVPVESAVETLGHLVERGVDRLGERGGRVAEGEPALERPPERRVRECGIVAVERRLEPGPGRRRGKLEVDADDASGVARRVLHLYHERGRIGGREVGRCFLNDQRGLDPLEGAAGGVEGPENEMIGALLVVPVSGAGHVRGRGRDGDVSEGSGEGRHDHHPDDRFPAEEPEELMPVRVHWAAPMSPRK